jgi:hypothetical protein
LGLDPDLDGTGVLVTEQQKGHLMPVIAQQAMVRGQPDHAWRHFHGVSKHLKPF